MLKKQKTLSVFLFIMIAIGLFVALMSYDSLWQKAFEFLFPDEKTVLHPKASLLDFVIEHVLMVLVSSFLSILIGVWLGILVTRKRFFDFKDLVDNLSSIGQTFPPVAILALSVPFLNFGFKPTVFALFIYGLLPIIRNTIAGIDAVSMDILEASRGMGMSQNQILFKVQLPLAVKVILAGIRTSVIINIGTATIGATIGAGGLGTPIISGLTVENYAYILEGAIPAALMAMLFDLSLRKLEELW